MSLVGTTAIAGGNEAKTRVGNAPPVQQVILVDVTGSRIPQRLVRYNQQVNSASPLVVFGTGDILRTGATSVAGILASDPSITRRR